MTADMERINKIMNDLLKSIVVHKLTISELAVLKIKIRNEFHQLMILSAQQIVNRELMNYDSPNPILSESEILENLEKSIQTEFGGTSEEV